VPFKKMTEESLAHSITIALRPEVQRSVKRMSEQISKENGSADAAASFHSCINMDTMRCMLCPDRVAVWRIRKTDIRLSSLAAAVLLDAQIIRLSNLKLCGPPSLRSLHSIALLISIESGIETGISMKGPAIRSWVL